LNVDFPTAKDGMPPPVRSIAEASHAADSQLRINAAFVVQSARAPVAIPAIAGTVS
jgi:hypothetical protein